MVDPPGPEEVRQLVDQVLRGVARGDFADTLSRAAAFARVCSVGRAHLPPDTAGTTYTRTSRRPGCSPWPSSLEQAARLERSGRLG